MTSLRIWFQNKYRKPRTSLEWLDSDPYELYIEFMEEYFARHDEEAREARIKYLGYEVAPTGDPLIDKWEREIAQGKVPDLSEGEDDRAQRRDNWVKEQARRHFEETGELLYSAPLPQHIQLIEMLRQGKDPYEINVEGDSFQDANFLEHVPPEHFDDFLEAANLLKGK